MGAAGKDGQCLIDTAALAPLIETLEGKPYELKPYELKNDTGFRLKVALEALNDGGSLTGIIQRATCQVEKYVITQILALTNGNKAQTARILKIDYKTLYRKMQRYVI